MPSVRAQGVAYAHTDAVPLLTDVHFQLVPGWTGLVGANGAGKSTLLRLIAGELRPTEGSLALEPRAPLLRLCPQQVDALTPDVEAFAEAQDGLSRRLLGRLQLNPWELTRWPTLSPGERKRWQVGAALAAEPELLLLDEPTNHLDAEGRALLVGALERFRGVGLLVSHDRTLLDALTSHTLRVHGGSARLWSGGYSQARAEWEAEAQGVLQARAQAKEAHRRAEQQLAQARRDREAANRARSGRHLDKHDSDSRTLGAKTLVAWAEAGLGRRVGILRRQTERTAEALESVEVEKSLGRSIFVDYARAPKPTLFALDAPVLEAGGAPLLHDVHLSLGREDRVWLRGPNGAGKSTLLQALLADARVPRERVLYLPQDLSPEAAAEALARVRALPETERGRVLSLVAALGVDPQRLLASERPSPGEARKLLLALGLGEHAWALVLDEPTNHLDLPSIERLEEALQGFPGTLLLVTHDEAFARRCTTLTWTLREGRIEQASG
ncbi:ABC-F family ATP-binding cassette domain-containing protein [Aggregicoccus sp. 17bor-14]|uniref:ATP-binding cassette domain-containing protein n=1 Tax=Myxococcaceae TaxID=31 RepID=UPI00129C7852|nr:MULTISPECIES: ATP-binding cassette domain-containing protein [Myxococcaceae]MBF5040980.1 ABC-F family ATP-binding cassette domain-containing protein [Simulacricoccus sp. 17bor-14]MRI86767.1 ABC-F family ATP-binding cassette domain-containing protein [Aggregicoccus sp. 17bor-14]